MYNIALINPPSPFLIDERVFPNIGIVRVATALKEHNVKIIDLTGKKNYLKVIRDIANDFDYYAFSSTTPQFPYTYKMFKELKLVNPKAKTILGGSHASAISSIRKKLLQYGPGTSGVDINIKPLNEFDTVFEGEGEDIENIFKPGWQKGKLIKNLDDVLIPNYDLIDLKSYKYKLFGKKTTSIQTQRGCPHQCSFCCGRDIEMYNHVRNHSPERILKELDLLNKKYGFKSFMWYDDEINLNMNKLENLCKALSTRSYQHRGFIRSDMIVKHPESVKWMKDAGFVKLCAGVESGSNRILEMVGKKTTSQTNMKARQIIKDYGIHYEAFMLLGHPGETMDDVGDTFIWLKEAEPDDFDINLVTPYPGSKMYDEAIPTNFKGYKWNYKGLYFNKPDYSKEDSYYKGLDRQGKSDIRTKEISNKTYIKLRNVIEKCIK